MHIHNLSRLTHDHEEHEEHEEHSDSHHHGNDHHRDLNLRSAYLHVIADAATFVLAIVALPQSCTAVWGEGEAQGTGMPGREHPGGFKRRNLCYAIVNASPAAPELKAGILPVRK